MATGGQWHAVRVKPGSQRMARVLKDDDTPEHKLGETILERECRQEGIHVFMPAVWLCVLKHRSRKFVRRRLPLFTGYAFVNITPGDYEKVRKDVDSITAFLRQSRYSAPAIFAENLISRFALEDFERYQSARYEQAHKQEALRVDRIRKIRDEQNGMRHKIVGKGRRRNKMFAAEVEKYVEEQDSETQARWKALARELKSLEETDMPIETLKKIA